MERKKYNTKRQNELIEYLKSTQGQHITAQDAASYLRKNGSSIGVTTVYRQFEKLVDEGVLNKFETGEGCAACYEYMNPEDHIHDHDCFHARCEKCGKLIHLDCSVIAEIEKHLLEKHKFMLNPNRTVFYGICKECMAEVKL